MTSHRSALSPLPLLLSTLVAACAPLTRPAQRPAEPGVIERTPERLARGQYLVEHVTACLFCHSGHDWSRYTAPIRPEERGRGGVCLTPEHGAPGRICTQNISSHDDGVGRWTDGELLRAIREGVSRDGRALFPSMPYAAYARMSEEDGQAVVAYLRTLPARAGKPPATEIRFPTSMFLNLAPHPLEGPVAAPARDTVSYGRYLATLAGCEHCHTPRVRGDVLPGRDFAGGFVLLGPWGKVVSANITPHRSTGLGRFSRDEFIGRFKAFANFDDGAPARPSGATVMPWRELSGMTEEDLGAIYDFLLTVPPVEHAVATFPGG